MAVEFDHIFVCAAVGGEEANNLAAFGLTEGPQNVHPGQGTACRRFFFENFYLELLWVCDAGEAQLKTTRPTHLWERWRDRASGVCPFGLGFRPGSHDDGSVPFDSWKYCPAYLPAPLSFHVASNAHVLTEPMLFYLPLAQRIDRCPSAKRPPFSHRAGLRAVTRVELVSPHASRLSPAMAAVTNSGLARLRAGSKYLVELGFDGESQGQAADFRPELPLLFLW